MQLARPTSSHRAIASLEMIMVLPLLVLLAVFIFRVAEVGLHRASLIVEVRQKAWSQRQTGQGAEESAIATVPKVFRTVRNDGGPSGLIRVRSQRTISIAPINVMSQKITASHVVLTDVSDYRSTGFRRRGQFQFDPRSMRLAANLDIPSLNSLINLNNPDMRKMATDFLKDAFSKQVPLLGDFDKLMDMKNILNDPVKAVKEISDPDKLLEAFEGIGKAVEGIGKLGKLLDMLSDDSPR
jgi:hypothetical protein